MAFKSTAVNNSVSEMQVRQRSLRVIGFQYVKNIRRAVYFQDKVMDLTSGRYESIYIKCPMKNTLERLQL